VILVIGDGMGFAHVEAARLYAGAPLAFEAAPHRGCMSTHSATRNVPTDSAASATAISTGRKVFNTALSVALPGDGSDLDTLVEYFHREGKAAGLVTTSYLTDATPGAMAAHALLRVQLADIAGDYLEDTRPEVLLGGGGNELDPMAAAAAGYSVVTDRTALQALVPTPGGLVAGLFGESVDGMPYEWDHAEGLDPGYDTLPFLREMTAVALDLLATDPDGFFLLVEQENTDRAGHSEGSGPERIGRDVFAVLELDAAVSELLAFAQGRDDTLIVVTADHETGGLDVLADLGAGELPEVSWATTDHTPALVPVYAWGPNASILAGCVDNTDLRRILTVPEPDTAAFGVAAALALAALTRTGRRGRS
jgi:alkaline phosphatase